MQLSILTPGKLKKSYLREGCDEYLARLLRYTRIQVLEVREEPVLKGIDALQVKRREGARLGDRKSWRL